MGTYLKLSVLLYGVYCVTNSSATVSTETLTSVFEVSKRMKNTLISADVEANVVLHDKQAILKGFPAPSGTISSMGTTSNTIEYQHQLTYTIGKGELYLKTIMMPESKHPVTYVQHKGVNTSITLAKTENDKTVYTNELKQLVPYQDFSCLLPDRTDYTKSLSLSNNVETSESLVATSQSAQRFFTKRGSQFYLEKSLINIDGKRHSETVFENHVYFKTFYLPSKVLDKLYSKNGNLFRTVSYNIKYVDDQHYDSRVLHKPLLPNNAIKVKPDSNRLNPMH